MSPKNIALLTLLGTLYLGVALLTFIVHPGGIVTALGLPAAHGAVMHEVD